MPAVFELQRATQALSWRALRAGRSARWVDAADAGVLRGGNVDDAFAHGFRARVFEDVRARVFSDASERTRFAADYPL